MEFLNYARYQWDRVAGAVAVALGAMCLLLGWVGVSGTAYPAEQLPYIVSGGLFGLFLLGVGGVLWLSADLRDEWRKLDEIQQQLPAELGDLSDAAHHHPGNGSARRPGRRPARR